MKPIQFVGNSLAALRTFPQAAKREAGYQLDRVQRGLNPTDWRPMISVGTGVREIRIHAGGQFRVMYLATLSDRVVVLHAFGKKSRKARDADIRQAREALKALRMGN